MEGMTPQEQMLALMDRVYAATDAGETFGESVGRILGMEEDPACAMVEQMAEAVIAAAAADGEPVEIVGLMSEAMVFGLMLGMEIAEGRAFAREQAARGATTEAGG